jgi:hypothetical protein
MTRTIRVLTVAAVLFPSVVTAQGMDMSSMGGSNTSISGYGDVSYKSRKDNNRPGFDYGIIDLFIASSPMPKLQFGAEVALYRNRGGELAPDLERAFVKYNWRPELTVAVGRFHTPLGYWNSAFHHGAFMQPIIDRPYLFNYEEEEGILPLHSIGVMVSGRNIGDVHFGYDLSWGSPLSTQGIVPDNKPTLGAVNVQIEPISDFIFGASASLNKRAAGSTTALTTGSGTLAADLEQTSAGVYVAHFGSQTELVIDQQFVQHKTPSTGVSVNSHGGYAYGGLRFGDFIPYVFVQNMYVDSRDVFLAAQDRQQYAAGARWELSAKASWRVEGRYERRTDGTTGFTYASQLAFAF